MPIVILLPSSVYEEVNRLHPAEPLTLPASNRALSATPSGGVMPPEPEVRTHGVPSRVEVSTAAVSESLPHPAAKPATSSSMDRATADLIAGIYRPYSRDVRATAWAAQAASPRSSSASWACAAT